jgi:hypothetical protein
MLNERRYRGEDKEQTGGGQEEAAMKSAAKLVVVSDTARKWQWCRVRGSALEL